MSTFEAISLIYSEQILQLQFNRESLQIDFDPSAGTSLFYATFDGKLSSLVVSLQNLLQLKRPSYFCKNKSAVPFCISTLLFSLFKSHILRHNLLRKFFTVFLGICMHAMQQKSFRISFMICSGQETEE